MKKMEMKPAVRVSFTTRSVTVENKHKPGDACVIWFGSRPTYFWFPEPGRYGEAVEIPWYHPARFIAKTVRPIEVFDPEEVHDEEREALVDLLETEFDGGFEIRDGGTPWSRWLFVVVPPEDETRARLLVETRLPLQRSTVEVVSESAPLLTDL
jgi:hypothetical protein